MFITKCTKKIVFTVIGTIFVICLFSTTGCSVRKLNEQDRQWIHDQVHNQAKIATLERINAWLTKENEKLREENKELKRYVDSNINPNSDNTEPEKKNEESTGSTSNLDPKVNLRPSQEENQSSPRRKIASFGRKLRIGDELPHFTYNSVVLPETIPIKWLNNVKVGPNGIGPLESISGILVILNSTFNESIDVTSLKKSTSISMLWIENSTFNGTKYNLIHFKEGNWIELKNGSRYICATPKGCTVDLTNFAIIEGEMTVSTKYDDK